jgi:hypothetical protein
MLAIDIRNFKQSFSGPIICFAGFVLLFSPAAADTIPFSVTATNISETTAIQTGFLQLIINGQFFLPAVDPNLYTVESVSAEISGELGGAGWFGGLAIGSGAIMGGWGLAPGSRASDENLDSLFDPVTNVGSAVALATLTNFGLSSFLLPEPSEIESFVAVVNVESFPNAFAFVKDPILSGFYTVIPNQTQSLAASSDSASDNQPIYTLTEFAPGQSQIPANVVAQLPSYLNLSAPEPSSEMLAAAGALILALVWRNTARKV